MTYLETQYFGFNRILLLALGLWPYEQSIFVRLQLILLYSILISFIIFQFTAFVTLKCSVQIVIEICSNAFFFIICILKYNAFSFNLNTVKHLLELLQHIHDELRDKDEVAIIENYWIIANRVNGILALLGLLACSSPLCLPYIVDTIYFTNESQSSPSLHITTEYFIDKERYSFFIRLHSNAAIFISLTALIAPGTMNIMYFIHVCGMFKIASYRIEQAMAKVNLETNKTKGRNMVHIGIIYAVDMHRKAMHMIQLLMSALNMSIFIFFMTAVISASLNLFRIFQEITSGCNIKKLILPSLFLTVIYVYLLLANIMAQQITDHNNDVFVTAYSVQWYEAPVHIQKLILFLLQRGTKHYYVILGGLFVACLEGFGTLITSSVSYFTFIYSTNRI
ncbi:odorant receptor 30a-like isoform X2 [Linepithema humile]|uniref:odorant receptor 30a-like isoform X2 n=1 Tax=Linepithema humile TaxID=83485 RepID=UPI00351E88F4